MAITYNAGTNIITVTGYTAGTPCTFLDVYNADVAGSWGKVTRQCTNQFCFGAQLCIGDGSTATYFADNHIHAHWSDIWTAHWQYTIRGRTNSHATLTGCSISMVPSASNYAVSIGGGVIAAEYAPDFNLIYCQITVEAASRPLYHYYTTGKIEHCILYNCLVSDTSNCDIKDVVVKNDYTAANGFLTLVGGTLDDIKIYSPPIAIYLGASAPSATFKNLTCGDIATYDIQVINHSTSHYFINTVFQSASWRLNQSSFTGAVYRQYEFDLKVTDKDNVGINGATVKIWDKDSNLVVDVTTGAGGVIFKQTITRGYYNQANGNTLQEASPHLIKIEKSGTDYLTYEKDFTLDHKTDWEVTMVNMTDLRNDIAALDTKIDTVQTDLDNPNQYKADVPTVGEIADAVWDEILTGATHNIATSAGRRVRETGAYAIDGGTAQGGNGFSITLAATASGDDGVYNRNLIVLTDNTGAGQTRTIVDYDATSKVCVVDREWRVSPDATTTYQVVPDDTPLTVDHGRARGGTSTTITLRAYASAVDNTYLCNQIGIIAGPGRGQSRLVGAYNGTTKVVTICGDPWVTTPTTDSIYVMMPYGTTCTSCIGDHALEQIKNEVDVMKLLPFAV